MKRPGSAPKEPATKKYAQRDTGSGRGSATGSGRGSATGSGRGSATGSGRGSECADDFIGQCLAAHNKYRARHDARPLAHDAALTDSAQRWAEQVAASGQFAHSKGRQNVGENIAMKWTSDRALMSGTAPASFFWITITKTA